MASAPACVRLRSTTSKPHLAATSATPAPMIPEPTTPIRFTPITSPLSGKGARLPRGNFPGLIGRFGPRQ